LQPRKKTVKDISFSITKSHFPQKKIANFCKYTDYQTVIIDNIQITNGNDFLRTFVPGSSALRQKEPPNQSENKLN
jgi:hypothetical protein